MDSTDKLLPFTSRISASYKRLTSLVGQKLAISGTWRKLPGMMERTTLSQGVLPPLIICRHIWIGLTGTPFSLRLQLLSQCHMRSSQLQ